MKKIKIAIIATALLANLASTVSAVPLGESVDYLPPQVNMGLGVIDPAAKLEVNGQVMIRGGNPQEGYVLTSDSDGLATWSAIAPQVNVASADAAKFADSSSVLRSPDASIDPALFIDNNGDANFTASKLLLDGASLNFGSDKSKAITHTANDLLEINSNGDFAGGVNISDGAIIVDGQNNVTFSNGLTINGDIVADELMPTESKIIAVNVPLNQTISIPANRCGGAIRVDYSGTYKMLKVDDVTIRLNLDGANVDGLYFRVWWPAATALAVVYGMPISGFYFIEDIENPHEIKITKDAGKYGVHYTTWKEATMDITCI